MGFEYTWKKRFSMGNRIAIKYALTDVQDDSSSVLRTPFKKVTGYLIENEGTAASTIRVVATTERTPANNESTLTLDAGSANDEGSIVVVGLL